MKGLRPFLLFFLFVVLLHLIALGIRYHTQKFSPRMALKIKVERSERKFPREGKQIVASEESADQNPPEQTDFLSDKDRRFDRQTRAKNASRFQKAAKGDAAVTYEGKKRRSEGLKKLKLSDLGAGENSKHSFVRAASDYTGSQKGSTSDYLPEIPLGELTHLNTKKYKFYGFYHRIRQKLEQFWGRSLAEKARQMARAGRRLASHELLTSLQVTLDPQGEITAIKILGPSGVREVDDAAVESFNEAGPFPNPPRDLIVEGRVVIEWGFVVKI